MQRYHEQRGNFGAHLEEFHQLTDSLVAEVASRRLSLEHFRRAIRKFDQTAATNALIAARKDIFLKELGGVAVTLINQELHSLDVKDYERLAMSLDCSASTLETKLQQTIRDTIETLKIREFENLGLQQLGACVPHDVVERVVTVLTDPDVIRRIVFSRFDQLLSANGGEMEADMKKQALSICKEISTTPTVRANSIRVKSGISLIKDLNDHALKRMEEHEAARRRAKEERQKNVTTTVAVGAAFVAGAFLLSRLLGNSSGASDKDDL